MKLYLNNISPQFKNVLKYILQIENIDVSIRSTYIKYDEQYHDTVKNIYKNLLKIYQPSTQVITQTITTNNGLPTVTFTSSSGFDSGILLLTGTITNNGGSTITDYGFYIYFQVAKGPAQTLLINPTIQSCSPGEFQYTVNITSQSSLFGPPPNYIMNYQAYATNSYGTAYSEFQTYYFSELCLAENTRITLSDGTHKYIQDITYDDEMLVWNFDDGELSKAYPLWIKKTEQTTQYNLLTFSDGTQLKTIVQHRIFNKEAGKFTYPLTEDTPLQTTTFTDKQEFITLISKEIIYETINFYNIITNHHINLFANTILTSCRYNNIYPIKDMKFIKHEITPNNHSYDMIPSKYIHGLRLHEQQFNPQDNINYISNLIANETRIHQYFNNKKIIFLDHTGVLLKNNSTLEFELDNVFIIRTITERYNIDIVVSSDWTNFMTFNQIKDLYNKHNLKTPIDYTHKNPYKFEKNHHNIEEYRANEIQTWLKQHKYNNSEWLAIDDLNLTQYLPATNFLWIKDGLGLSTII
ncbi:MAG: hypothetical protein Gaeavirus1_50 [Gaeavirus sp.]|uniref:Hedgehog/Intein (Hint) domain-containing protein n=1 Tax=Gaeavirus sp. TaxID=2487767 RepID=A0A3G5A239_9VIRU|nr:MAG: hypothetical protein Gaeavirus1_50 [Gaeavirus sp.]